MRIGRHLLLDLLQNRVVIGSFLLFSLIGWGTFMVETQPEKALLILLQLSLLALPLISMVFGSIYYYNSSDLITLILSQPIERKTVIWNLYLGLSSAFLVAYLLGIGLPLLVYHPGIESVFLLTSGSLLIFVFVALALFISTAVQDRVRGMGVTLILWAFFTFLFDGLLLFLMYQFGEYPIEKLILGLSFLNPIDIARISVIMQTEASALMGLTGAIFADFFLSSIGILASYGGMLLWASLAYLGARRNFLGKDL
jgi:Cu-processing system permease protein